MRGRIKAPYANPGHLPPNGLPVGQAPARNVSPGTTQRPMIASEASVRRSAFILIRFYDTPNLTFTLVAMLMMRGQTPH
jgi:hypothetical protein